MTEPHRRFCFADFVISPRQRLLLRDGRPVPLIPKYFDLLLLLVERRGEAVAKEAIFAHVWSDVVVSDGALSQAVRTLRRTLGDDVREPRFIRTVSRHGYQFVWPDVTAEADEGHVATPAPPPEKTPTEKTPEKTSTQTEGGGVVPLVDRLMAAADPADARDLAEQLHALGTADALATLATRAHHAPAVAMMRDARWSVPGAGDVPLLRDTEAPGAIAALVRLRLADVRRVVALRWLGAAGTGALGGAAAGLIGGVALVLAPMSNARLQSSIALAAIGAVAGGIGAGGIAAGLVTAEALARSRRTLALVACGALAGGLVAMLAAVVFHALLDALFGLRLGHGGGAVDGLVLGAAAGLGYGLTTAHPDGGMAAPRGARRLMSALIVGVCCAVGATALAIAGRPLIGGLVHEIARASQSTELVLAPLGRLIGEPGFGPRTQAVLSAFEGGFFGVSLAWGLTRRPKSEWHN